MSNFDLRTTEGGKDMKSLGQGVSLGVALTVKRLHHVLTLWKPEERVFCVLMAVQLQSHWRSDCRDLGFFFTLDKQISLTPGAV